MTSAPTVDLAGGTRMPVLGLGTWPLDDDQAQATVAQAVERGWRLIDTAYRYGNETGVGRGIRDCGLPRDELFVTTKLNGEWHGRESAAVALKDSLSRLRLEYVDLYLIHWPLPWKDQYVDAWQGLLGLREAGLARAVGVSNFKPAHINRLLEETGVAPEVNQIQADPTLPRSTAWAYHATHGIVTQSWSPLGQGSPVLRDATIERIAQRHQRTPAQIILRWHLQLGLTVVTKTASPDRLTSNLAVFDFELSEADLAEIAALDQGEDRAVDSDKSGH